MYELIVIIIIYVLVFFVLSRFVIPHLGFFKTPLPKELPPSMDYAINKIKSEANSPYNFLELSYETLGNKYRSERFNTFLRFSYLFKDLNEIWEMQGYIPCTQSSFLMRIFLVHSGQFSDEDIKIKHTFFNFNIHQYLQVKISNKWIDVDVGEKQRGMPIGKHLKFFG